jgi:hypothetical protein
MVLDSSERNFKELLAMEGEPRAPLKLTADGAGGLWDLKEMAMAVGPFKAAPPTLTDYAVVKKSYVLPDQIIESAFYRARFSWGEGDTFSLSSPIMAGPIAEKEIIAVLEYLKPSLPGTGPMSLNQDGMTHLALADLSGPVRWTGFWTCPASNHTYQLSLESAHRVTTQKELAEFIQAFACHRGS